MFARLWQSSIFVLILAGGLACRLIGPWLLSWASLKRLCRLILAPSEPYCYPLPSVENADVMCDGNTSLLPSSSCSVRAVGVLGCHIVRLALLLASGYMPGRVLCCRRVCVQCSWCADAERHVCSLIIFQQQFFVGLCCYAIVLVGV